MRTLFERERHLHAGSLVFVAALWAVLATSCGSANTAPTPGRFEIQPRIEELTLNDSVQFYLLDTATGERIDASGWSIVSPHNVPGDRGVIRSDGLYTAPRESPYEHEVKIRAVKSREESEFTFGIFDPDFPDPEATIFPGQGGYRIKVIRTSTPIEGGIRAGETVIFSLVDQSTGEPVVVDHFEIQQNNRIIEDGGDITIDGVYTAPAAPPDPPEVRIGIYYLREGGRPGDVSFIGPSILILPPAP